jgi:hypothetical protein
MRSDGVVRNLMHHFHQALETGQSLRYPNRRNDGQKYHCNHSDLNQTFGDGTEMYSRHRTSKWAKPCRPKESINLKATRLEWSNSTLLHLFEGAIAGCLNETCGERLLFTRGLIQLSRPVCPTTGRSLKKEYRAQGGLF